MLKTTLISAVMATSASLANAGSTDVFLGGTAGSDWGGIYAGGHANVGFGSEFEYIGSDGLSLAVLPFATANMYGVFSGYNLQLGNLVYGAELAYSVGPMGLDGYGTDYEINNMLDIKGRVGYSLGRALVYGVAGLSVTEFQDGDSSTVGMLSGVNLGVGADFMVTDQFFVGAEYVARSLHGDDGFGFTWEATVQTVAIRAGISF